MSRTLTVACLQPCAGPMVGPNLAAIADLVRRARDAGAAFIATPENTAMIEPRRAQKWQQADQARDPHSLTFMRDLARETGAMLLVGSLTVKPEPDDPDQRLANRSYLIGGDGAVIAHYDKIHMFDVDLANGESYRESSQFRPGDRAVVAPTPWGPVGLSICYDLRFPALYRALAQAGARIITIPAAFTVPTGTAHWHVLIRARAIETGCFILAPAQTGTHAEGRQTYGHSLIVAPWGEVLADGGTETGFILADLDLDRVEEARRMVPSLKHDRPFTLPTPIAD